MGGVEGWKIKKGWGSKEEAGTEGKLREGLGGEGGGECWKEGERVGAGGAGWGWWGPSPCGMLSLLVSRPRTGSLVFPR